jgi:hypothetical protein
MPVTGVVKLRKALSGLGAAASRTVLVSYTFNTPESDLEVSETRRPLPHPQAMYRSSADTAIAVPCRHPSSRKTCTHSRAARSQTYTRPWSDGESGKWSPRRTTSKSKHSLAVRGKSDRRHTSIHLQNRDDLLCLRIMHIQITSINRPGSRQAPTAHHALQTPAACGLALSRTARASFVLEYLINMNKEHKKMTHLGA